MHPPVKHIPHYFWVICVLIAALILIFGGNYDAKAQGTSKPEPPHVFTLCAHDMLFAVFIFDGWDAAHPRQIQVWPVAPECPAVKGQTSLPPV